MKRGQGDQQGEDGYYCQGPEVCFVGHGNSQLLRGLTTAGVVARVVGLDSGWGGAAGWAGWLGRHDLPHPGDARLVGQGPQQGNGDVGLDVVHSHVAGVAALVFQEPDHGVGLGGQVDGYRHRVVLVDGGFTGGLQGGGLS